MNNIDEVKGLNYYERHLGDYAKETRHLSLLEHGVYTILLDYCFATGQPIPQTQTYRYACAKTRAEKRAVDSVLAEFFILQTGWYVSKLVKAYLEAKDKRAQTSKENGKLGGRPGRKPEEADKADKTDKNNENLTYNQNLRNNLEKSNEKPKNNLTETYQEPNPNLKKPVPIAINPIANIYKSKAQQQQLSRPGASAAPVPTPGNGSQRENFPTQPQPQPAANAESANGPKALTGLLAKATHAIAPENPRPADRLAEPLPPTAAPESQSAASLAVQSEADPADPIKPTTDEQDYARVWDKLNTQQRYVLLEIAGAKSPEQLEVSAAATWWQFPKSGRKKLIDAIETLRQPQPDTLPANVPAGADTAANPESLPADPAVDLKKPENAPATPPAPPPAHTDSDLSALEASLAHANDPDKGFIHADPKAAKNDAKQTLSETPAQNAPVLLTDAAFLQTSLPQGVDVTVWYNFERMAREKVRWSAGTCFTLQRQLRQAIAAGADGNALLEWATVRSLIDLPDAWQRMQADAVRQAKQSEGNAHAMPTDDATVAQTATVTVNETVEGTVSEGVSEGVIETVANEKPKQNLKKPNETRDSTGKSKKKEAKRQAKKPDDVSDDTWEDFVEHRKNLKKPVSETVVKMFRKQAQKARIPLEEAMQIALLRGWCGFQAEWIENENSQRMQQTGRVTARLTPDTSGRLPGESVSDAAMRVYIAKQEKRARGELKEPLKINLFNTDKTPELPALPMIKEDETK